MTRILIFTTIFFFTIGWSYGQSCDLINEDMENGSTSNYPSGWACPGVYVGNIGGNSYSGSYYLGFNDNQDSVVIPSLNCPGQVCFYWRTSATSADFDFNILWSDDNQQSWNTAMSFSVEDSSNIDTYRQTCVNLPSGTFQDTSVSIAFVQTNRIGGSLYLEDVCVSQGTCNSIIIDHFEFNNYPAGCTSIENQFDIQVNAINSLGFPDTNYNGAVTLSDNAGNITISGTTTVNFSNGIANFTGLTISSAGSYVLKASNDSISGLSDTITITEICEIYDTLTIMSYNLLNFPNGGSCGATTVVANRQDTLKKILDYVKPDIFMICELNNEAGADLVLNNSLNHSGISKYKRANFVANQSSGYKELNNMFFYNSDKVTLFEQDEIITGTRDVGKYIVYGNDPNLSQNDTLFMSFFETHLKAGSGSSDENQRASDASTIRTHMNNFTNKVNILGGDFNLYSSDEAAYQNLINSGLVPFNDPINRSGNWSGTSSYADIHTQSTRSSDDIECGAWGGMDDRFDFILLSDSLMDSNSPVHYVSGSYNALGNNGSTYNDDINASWNSSGVPREVLNAMFYMSDHLPVILKLAISYPATEKPADTTGIYEDQATTKISVFPNPSTGVFLIRNENNTSQDVKLSIFNQMGQEILRQGFVQQASINLSGYPKGIYYARFVLDTGEAITRKLVVK